MTTAVVVVCSASCSTDVVTAAAATSIVVVDTTTLDEVVTATGFAAGAGGVGRGRKRTIVTRAMAIASAKTAAIAGQRRGAFCGWVSTVAAAAAFGPLRFVYATVGATARC